MTQQLPDIALLHHHFGPYHVARADALERLVPGRTRFIQLASREGLREWQVRGKCSEVITIAEGVLEQLPQRRLAKLVTALLDDLRPNAVVIAGYSHAAMRAAARWCARRGAAAILLSDSHQADRPRPRLKEWAKRAWISRNFDAVFTAGAMSAAYARSLGFASSRIWRGYDVVDNAFFATAAAAARARASTLLSELGLPAQVFVYVGRFAAEKNLHRLIDAMGEYRHRAGARAWGLLLVGGGPDRERLEEQVRSLRGSVAVTPFKQGDALAEIYGAAAALILPSTSEPWGLVVNEAMACGLPVLVSERAGSVSDLVFPGINGYVFNPESKEDMVEAMLRLSSEQVDRCAMGRASERIIANFTPDTWAAALTDAVDVTVSRRRRGD